MNYYKEFGNLEIPTYHIKKKKPTKACFEQPFANNNKGIVVEEDSVNLEDELTENDK